MDLAIITRVYPALATWPQAVLEEFFAPATLGSVSGGAMLSTGNTPCVSVDFLLSGSKRIYALGPGQRELTLYEVSQGEVCPLNVICVLAGRPFPALGSALSDVETVHVPARHFLEQMLRHEPVRSFAYRLIYDDMALSLELLREVAFGNLSERLRNYLIEKSENGRLRTTHKRIANDLGTAREVVTRLLKMFRQDGFIETDSGEIVIPQLNP